MLDHFGSGISCDQTCKWGIEWDTCAPGLLSCVASDFPSSRLRTRMTQSWSFSPGTHIPLQNKKKLAHPTRFERVTFAFGGQAPASPIADHRITGFCRRRNPILLENLMRLWVTTAGSLAFENWLVHPPSFRLVLISADFVPG